MGGIILDEKQQPFDLRRLERAIAALVEAHRRLRGEHVALRADAEKQSLRIRTLEGQLLEANQLRQDVAKRIDELVAQIGQLDEQFASLDQ